MVDDLLVARNPDPESQLPYLIRIPLGSAGVVDMPAAAPGATGAGLPSLLARLAG